MPDLDYTEPSFEISVRASDDKSQVTLYLNIGTIQGGTDVLEKKRLGGPSTIITDVSHIRFRMSNLMKCLKHDEPCNHVTLLHVDIF